MKTQHTNLTAAAPGLLKALEDLLAVAGYDQPSLSELDLEGAEKEIIDRAHYFVAMAKGES